MGLFDFLSSAQDKINNLQKRINENPADAGLMQLKSKIKANKPRGSGAVIESHTPTKCDSTAQILAQRDSFIRNGFSEYEFIANSNCCSVCGELNGKHFLVSKLEIGVNAPPMHEGCRCSIAAYSDREEYEEWLNSL